MSLKLQLKQQQLKELSAEFENKEISGLKRLDQGRRKVGKSLESYAQLLGSVQSTLLQLHALTERLHADTQTLTGTIEQLQESSSPSPRGKPETTATRYQRRAARLLHEAQPEVTCAIEQLKHEICYGSYTSGSQPSPQPDLVAPPYSPPRRPGVGGEVPLGLYPQVDLSSKDSQNY